MESRKNSTDEPVCRAGIACRCRECTCGRRGGRRGWDESRVASIYKTTMCKIVSGTCCKHGELSSAL